ncbi:ATP-binding cassette domain-containing protein [Staphylococcus agnetis]|uniref:ATP-binding cassette domain-containing protein n=1 Tax=Staphylococcus agnetis TaxID=985762 RepID=UPI0021CFF4EB|nr:ATP-binding cassette domain-containing protein [Staphylococcus agnetis]UXU59900.1 ATP-binding cassette domain-containing protein [Staphylococcus agnetis]UXU62231.1 ATP-binding cassette domain-containing protein [Staphylococcus agnetis]
MIQLKNVSLGDTAQWRLRHINLTIKDGEKIGIIGESGSGKTSLGDLLIGIQRPTEGVIHHDLQIRLPIFQQASLAFNAKRTLGDSLEETHILAPTRQSSVHERCMHYIQQFGLPSDIVRRYPYEVSGGQLQRLNMIRTMIVEPDLIVCDEITANVDVLVEQDMIKHLNKYHNDTGKTLVIISHDLAFLSQCVERFVVLEDGYCVDDFHIDDMFYPSRSMTTKRFIEVYDPPPIK